ncbi:MAG: hypothetical protein ACXWC9_10220, partial [Pseudobdellovibrionaceae bacterium]
VTLADIARHFDECHVKFRGRFANECVEVAKATLKSRVFFYQDLQEDDWVSASLEMLEKILSRSLFIFLEDHKLVASSDQLQNTLQSFDVNKLDCLRYSFYKSSQLRVHNLLPMKPREGNGFHFFSLDSENMNLIGKISPIFYAFTLVSMVSVSYFREILLQENKKKKLYHPRISAMISRLFPYPQSRVVLKKINHFLSAFNMRLEYYHPSSPFNLEKMWFECPTPPSNGWQVGAPAIELFANYDDDNGAHGESLIKRGLYPFDAFQFDLKRMAQLQAIASSISFEKGQSFDCTYFSHQARISHAPIVEISVVEGQIDVLYQKTTKRLRAGESALFYSNLGPIIQSVETSKVNLKTFDEIFQKPQ